MFRNTIHEGKGQKTAACSISSEIRIRVKRSGVIKMTFWMIPRRKHSRKKPSVTFSLRCSLVWLYILAFLSFIWLSNCEANKRFWGASGLCDGGLGDTPLAAGTFDDVGGGVALTGILLRIIAALRGLQVERGTAKQVLLKVMEEMASKTCRSRGYSSCSDWPAAWR